MRKTKHTLTFYQYSVYIHLLKVIIQKIYDKAK